MADEHQATHWQGCWRAHHECAVVLLERILAGPEWEADCVEFGCTDPAHSSRSIRTIQGGPVESKAPADPPPTTPSTGD